MQPLIGVMPEEFIQQGIGYLVGNLIGMSF
jgi:hypothetical protein